MTNYDEMFQRGAYRPRDGLDEDGYPTDETIARIKAWDPEDFEGLMWFLKSVWLYEGHCSPELDGSWEVSTGGWSGHEDMISALAENHWWMFHWVGTVRGGHYLFAPRKWGHRVSWKTEKL